MLTIFSKGPILFQVYETGCQGLVVSAVMDRLISRVDDDAEASNAGKLVHIFQTGTPQTQALAAMNFPEEKVNKRVNIAFNAISHIKASLPLALAVLLDNCL